MIGGMTTDGGGGITPLVTEAEEDTNACLDWVGCGGLGAEVGDGISADGILLIVEGEENLSGPLEILGRIVPGEEEFPDEEHNIHEGPELDRPVVAGALRVFAGPQAEVEGSGDQVGDVVGSGVGGGCFLGDNGVRDSQGGGLFSLIGGSSSPYALS